MIYYNDGINTNNNIKHYYNINTKKKFHKL